MSTLYRPVLIESAEQAEALPKGAVVVGTRAGAIEKGSHGIWWSGLTQVPDRTPIGGSALVPIEAEEETTDAGGISLLHGSTRTWPAYRRLVTPWEES